ncbi:hypothetical protein V6N13_103511 [Hibiscus sabdariffa]|uniref:Uncharacterized protein n=1 Tax=Hibiscus sabdariffa TaxID=183260 RepID=A0ABR2A4T6_9ROSI
MKWKRSHQAETIVGMWCDFAYQLTSTCALSLSNTTLFLMLIAFLSQHKDWITILISMKTTGECGDYERSIPPDSGRGRRLLALILSAYRRFQDAETVLEFALDEPGSLDQWHTSGTTNPINHCMLAIKANNEQCKHFPLTVSIRSSLLIARSILMNDLQLESTHHDAWMNLGLIAKPEGSSEQAAEVFLLAAHELEMPAPAEALEWRGI